MPTLQEVFDCDRPVALVTGSGSPRVGRAIAMRLSQLGCRLALHANTSIEQAEQAAEEIRQKYRTEVIVTVGSLADDEVPVRMIGQTCAQFGRIDILVNSAAIWAPQPLESVTAEELRRYFDANTLGSFLCAQQAGLRMVEQTWGGSIVNVGDWATVRPYLDHAAYFPSKGAVETMTRSLAVELASRNRRIRVNCVQPGPVLLAADVSDTVEAKIAQSTLLGKIGSADHVAHAVQFLCENDFVTGVCLAVVVGRSMYAPVGLQVGLNSG